MLPLIAVLLAATPTPPSLSLLQPESGRYLSARLLVAQAAPTPPPLPPSAEVDLDERIRELTYRVGMLQRQIRAINTNWPARALVLSIVGYVLSPLALVGIPLLIFGAASLGEEDHGEAGLLLGVGLGLTAAGAAGIGLVTVGAITGIREASVHRARRDELVQERIRLEDELRDLKTRRDARGVLQARRWQPRPTVPLLAVRF